MHYLAHYLPFSLNPPHLDILMHSLSLSNTIPDSHTLLHTLILSHTISWMLLHTSSHTPQHTFFLSILLPHLFSFLSLRPTLILLSLTHTSLTLLLSLIIMYQLNTLPQTHMPQLSLNCCLTLHISLCLPLCLQFCPAFALFLALSHALSLALPLVSNLHYVMNSSLHF